MSQRTRVFSLEVLLTLVVVLLSATLIEVSYMSGSPYAPFSFYGGFGVLLLVAGRALLGK